jgi:predicted dehydrogenase
MAKTLRLGIIGCGGFVRKNHVKHIADHVPEFDIVGLCDLSEENIAALREELPDSAKPAVYRDHNEMLKDLALDGVIVSTPHTLHFAHARDALQAGVNVMVEKPMVTDSAHARELVALSEKQGKLLQIAIQGTYTDTFAYARKLLTDGTMGELQLVSGMLAQGWMTGTKGKWRQDPALSGGGQLYDSTAHVLSAMMFLVDSPVTDVHCWADNKGTPVDINAVACIKFANGAMASITSGGNCPTWYSHLVIQGDNAMMEISPHGGSFRVAGKQLEEDITSAPDDWDVPTVTPARNFADAILQRDTPRCGGHLGILLADLMDAIYDSIDAGAPVRVEAE